MHTNKRLQNLFKVIALSVFSLLVLLAAYYSDVQAAPGVDGDFIVTAANTILNRYSEVTSISGNTVTVNNIANLNDGSGHYTNNTLSTGDMILIYQAQGASFTNTTNTAAWGAFSTNNAGGYEFAVVASVSGNDITVVNIGGPPYHCGGIANTYDTVNGNVQVVRVPQYANLTVNGAASVVAPNWNGTTGGILALVVQNNLVINGTIDVTGRGFRGGTVHNNGASGQSGFRSVNPGDGADKGEGILGFEGTYSTNGLGRYGRGAPANGGGGGVGHNSAGGGGANGNNGGAWNGSGFVSATDIYAQAWDLDDGVNNGGVVPAYFQGGAGGGRGGYTYSANNGNALTQGPGNGVWGGDSRRQVGGLGGRPLNNNPATQVFFGGGGGAGDINNSNATGGGDGGGLVVIGADTLSGSGQIIAGGTSAANVTASSAKDAPGGGGAGGSIVVAANSVSTVSLSANGGNGGGQTSGTAEAEGSGGGGGGGFIALYATSGSLSTSVLGGANGTTASGSLTEFPPNGGSAGYAGNVSTATIAFPGCSTPTAVALGGVNIQQNWLTTAILIPALILLLGTTFYLTVLRQRQALKRD